MSNIDIFTSEDYKNINLDYPKGYLEELVITLQQENKEQEEYIKYWQNEYDKKVEIIDKALEFIKKYNIYWDDDDRINNAYIPKELKQILEGDSNE